MFLILLYFTASCVFVAFDSVAFHCYTSTYYRFAVARLSYFAMLHRTVLCTFHCPIAWCSMSLLDVCHLLQFLMSRFMRLILLLYFTVFLFIFPIPCVLLYCSISLCGVPLPYFSMYPLIAAFRYALFSLSYFTYFLSPSYFIRFFFNLLHNTDFIFLVFFFIPRVY